MSRYTPTDARILSLSPRIDLLPILHGSGDIAQEVRETLIGKRFRLLAVPLPPSVEVCVEQAVDRLPEISLIVLPGTGTRGKGPRQSDSNRSLSGRHHGHPRGDRRIYPPRLH